MELALFGAELFFAALLVLGPLGLGESDSLGAVHPSRVGGYQPRTLEQLDLVPGLAHLELRPM